MSLLITGGTGTFGRAFVADALKRGVDRICIYSRGEHAQAQMREAFGDDPRLRFFIGDARDRDRLAKEAEKALAEKARKAKKLAEQAHQTGLASL